MDIDWPPAEAWKKWDEMINAAINGTVLSTKWNEETGEMYIYRGTKLVVSTRSLECFDAAARLLMTGGEDIAEWLFVSKKS